MDKSDIQETLVSLYLRLNGYFVVGFIVHAAEGVRTEMDVLAVRFPLHAEPEREVLPCSRLAVPTDRIDFLVGEVKGGSKIIFNSAFWTNSNAIRAVLRRFGAFDDDEIQRLGGVTQNVLDPANLRKSSSFPQLDVKLADKAGGQNTRLRFVLFAVGRARGPIETGPYIFQDDLFAFIWKCFRPEVPRSACDVRYNKELWGAQFERMVDYFKSPVRTNHGTIADLYEWMQLPSAKAVDDEIVVPRGPVSADSTRS